MARVEMYPHIHRKQLLLIGVVALGVPHPIVHNELVEIVCQNRLLVHRLYNHKLCDYRSVTECPLVTN